MRMYNRCVTHTDFIYVNFSTFDVLNVDYLPRFLSKYSSHHLIPEDSWPEYAEGMSPVICSRGYVFSYLFSTLWWIGVELSLSRSIYIYDGPCLGVWLVPPGQYGTRHGEKTVKRNTSFTVYFQNLHSLWHHRTK